MSDEPSLHRVLVVARTLAGHGVCVGAMERSGAPRRLVPDYGQATWNWPRDARFRVGQEWDLWYVERPGIPPHVEDAVVSQRLLPPNPVAVHDLRKARRIIKERAVVWTGPLDGWGESAPFDGSVRIFKNLRPTVFDAKQDSSPVEFGSVGFWRPPYELMAEPSGTSVRFRFTVTRGEFRDQEASIVFKGDCEPPNRITPADLVRLSLTRPQPTSDEKSSPFLLIQLSGVFPGGAA